MIVDDEETPVLHETCFTLGCVLLDHRAIAAICAKHDHCKEHAFCIDAAHRDMFGREVGYEDERGMGTGS